MKRIIGVLLAGAMVVSIATACGNSEKQTSVVSGQQSTNEATTAAELSTQNLLLERYPMAGAELQGDKMGFVCPEWVALFGKEKLANSSKSGMVYTLGGYHEGMAPVADMDGRVNGGASDFALPQLNADTEDAKIFNANIQALADKIRIRNIETQHRKYVGTLGGTNYVVYEIGDYISILILRHRSAQEFDLEEDVAAFVYNKKQGKFLNRKELMAATGATLKDLEDLDKWFVMGDLYTGQNCNIYYLPDKHNYVDEASKSMFLLWKGFYGYDGEGSDYFSEEATHHQDFFDTEEWRAIYPLASLYIDDKGELCIAGRRVIVTRDVTDDPFSNGYLDAVEYRVKAANVRSAVEEARALEKQDDPISHLYSALAAKAGINPADGPNVFVIRIGKIKTFINNGDLSEEDKSEPKLQGVMDILNERYPNESLAEHMRISIDIPSDGELNRLYELYLLVPKNKWWAVTVRDAEKNWQDSALGGALVAVGAENAIIEYGYRGQVINSIGLKDDTFLDFANAKDFMDVTELVKRNQDTRYEIIDILGYIFH